MIALGQLIREVLGHEHLDLSSGALRLPIREHNETVDEDHRQRAQGANEGGVGAPAQRAQRLYVGEVAQQDGDGAASGGIPVAGVGTGRRRR